MFRCICRVLPLKRAAVEKAQEIRAAAASSFKSMLHEKGDISVNSRWSRVRALCIFLVLYPRGDFLAMLFLFLFL